MKRPLPQPPRPNFTRILDRFDLEAMRDGAAVRSFNREYALDRPATKSQAKRGVVRGKEGAKGRTGLLSVPA